MAGGYGWNEGEIAKLLELGAEQFALDYPHRTYDAARHKLFRLRAEGHAATTEPALPEITGNIVADSPRHVDEIRAASEAMFQARQQQEATGLRNVIQFGGGPVAIFFVGDQHIGNAGTDVRRIFEEQEVIMATPGAYVVMTGDTVDNFIIGKLISQNMYESLAVRDQWTLACAYIENFGTRIIAKVSGNHDQWTTKLMGLDYDRRITPNGILYDTDDITFTAYTTSTSDGVCVRVRHKWRGGSIYNPSHGIERAARFDSSRPDVFVGAHVHQGATAREFILDGQRKLALMSSSYKVIDTYQKQEGFPDNDASTAVALVIEDDGSFWGTSNIRAVGRYMQRVYR